MPPLPTSSDPFTALAEPRRREIVELLAKTKHHTVNDLVDLLGIPQPSVSKHLGVLRKVGLVTVEKNGQHRFYALNPIQLKPVHDWIAMFEHFWTDHLDAIKKAAEKKARERRQPPPGSN
ncbi:MAG TPA: metalloregulator ArsR/SmtB family transcription factor [Phycisphaerae bacterium]|nr:metalloregulator ArsR/SmtB family transcription factor [Phycisphaerae bacterium]